MQYNLRIIPIPDLQEAKAEMKLIGADKRGIDIMAPKAVFRAIKVEGVDIRGANLLKQDMLSRGGEAVVSRAASALTADTTDVLLLGTLRQYKELIARLKHQPFGLRLLAAEMQKILHESAPPVLRLRNLTLDLSRPHIMGILNVTPDSFSDGNQYLKPDKAVKRALDMVEQGASIIDIGGESTRPGHQRVTPAQELERIGPVIAELVSELPVPLSVDTSRAEVASQVLDMGVHMINDVGGLSDLHMAETVAEYNAAICIMHGLTEHRQDPWPKYDCIMSTLTAFFHNRLELIRREGIAIDQILIDPGLGFGKHVPENLEIQRRLPELFSIGAHLMVGPSRKRMIGQVLDVEVKDRIEGTAACVAAAVHGKARVIRVHDVKEMVRVARMTDAIYREDTHD